MSLVEVLIDLNRIQEAAALEQQVMSIRPDSPRYFSQMVGYCSQRASGRKRSRLSRRRFRPIRSPPSHTISWASPKGHSACLTWPRPLSLGHLPFSRDDRGSSCAGVAYGCSGRQRRSPAMAAAALQARPGLPLAQLANAQALLATGNPQQAEAALQDLLKQDPTSLPALAQLLNVYMVQGKTAQAVERIAGLVQQNPRNAGLHFLLALGYFNLKDLDKSESSLSRRLRLIRKRPRLTVCSETFISPGAPLTAPSRTSARQLRPIPTTSQTISS